MLGFIPKDRTSDKRKTKRGRHGGVKLCLRRQQVSRTPLPSVILGNVQSLRKELGELQERQFPERFQEQRCVMAFSETWLTEQDQDVHFLINGFGAPSRCDRDTRVTGKSQGGGVCLYFSRTAVGLLRSA